MRIVIATSEAIPYIKTGGLADVAGALFAGFRKLGHDVSLFLPLYEGIQKLDKPKKILSAQKLHLGERMYYFDVIAEKETYFIANDYFFRRSGLYGNRAGDYPDNVERFAFFSKAVLHVIKSLGLTPHVIHTHDWQTALIPLYLSTDHSLTEIRTVFTIHNMGYQGIAPHDAMRSIGIPERYFTLDGIEYYGNINLLKAGIQFADEVTTVSPNYAREITSPQFGFGLSGVLKEKGVTGILNGLDYELWDPSSDTAIKAPFSTNDLNNRSLCKEDLCRMAGFRDRNKPLIGVIGRFAVQKGHDIIASELNNIVALNANMIILGQGDAAIEDAFAVAAARNPGKVHLITSFNDTIARKIYAGSDLFLMPSRYEPCGLAQMIAMRYGSVPIVNMTGGLADTVADYNTANSRGTGFVFLRPEGQAMVECLKRAFCVYFSSTDWRTIVQNVMKQRFKWSNSEKKYLNLFRDISGNIKHAHKT